MKENVEIDMLGGIEKLFYFPSLTLLRWRYDLTLRKTYQIHFYPFELMNLLHSFVNIHTGSQAHTHIQEYKHTMIYRHVHTCTNMNTNTYMCTYTQILQMHI